MNRVTVLAPDGRQFEGEEVIRHIDFMDGGTIRYVQIKTDDGDRLAIGAFGVLQLSTGRFI